jgi:hypothetical protein
MAAVLESNIAYTETGSPDAPAVEFLHGNLTSSYLGRNVTPHLADCVR